MDRKSELEAKKAKLEQMRREKAQKNLNAQTPQSPAPQTPLNDIGNVDPDKILTDLGINLSTTTTVVTDHQPGPNNEENTITNGVRHSRSHSGNSRSHIKSRNKPTLSINQVNAIDIAPKENVTYSKETQTPATEVADKNAKPVDYHVLTYLESDDEDETTSMSDAVSTSTGMESKTQKSTGKTQTEKGQQSGDDKSVDDRLKQLKDMTLNDDERQRHLESDDFLSFFTRNTRILEKALEQDDIFFEYGANDTTNEPVETGQVLKVDREFSDDRWRNRIVTWLDWSPHYPELLLASYEDSSLDPDGVALVWNSKFKSNTPEYIFNCSSWVTSCCFANFHPNLVIAGTYSGQIVMWDNRSNKRTPVQRSSLSAASHTHPIHCIQVVGSQNAHNLISISNDGKLCSWTLDNMNTPQETLELQCKQTRHVAVTSMGFRPGDVNNFIVGSEEGPIYTATRHGNKSGINESFEGHYGPVTGLSCHNVPGPIDFSHIFLTTSFDWSVKLWNLKEPGKPLYSFENNSDYVYDVAWSPINPALFATVDGTGRLDLWNLINDSEVPTASVTVDGAPALNKVRWNHNGHQLAVGDDQGKITLFDVTETYANPRPDDWSKFVRVLQDLKQSSAEMDESINAGNTSLQNTPVGLNSSSNILMPPSTPLSTSALQQVKSEPSFGDYRTRDYVSPPANLTQAFMSQLKQSPQTPK